MTSGMLESYLMWMEAVQLLALVLDVVGEQALGEEVFPVVASFRSNERTSRTNEPCEGRTSLARGVDFARTRGSRLGH